MAFMQWRTSGSKKGNTRRTSNCKFELRTIHKFLRNVVDVEKSEQSRWLLYHRQESADGAAVELIH